MLKKILSLSVIVSLFVSSMFASDGSKPTELMSLPHPIKAIMPNLDKLKISKEQEQKLKKEMIEVFPDMIQAKMKKIGKLEKEISKSVLKDNKTKEQLNEMLNKLEKMKRDVTNLHIDALNVLADILTKKQMEKSLKLLKRQKMAESAQGKSNKFRIDELVFLPHPGKFIKQGKITLTKEQKEKMKIVKKTIIPNYHKKMNEAFTLEKKLRRAVANGKPKESLKSTIAALTKLKEEALDIRLDALYELQKIFTKEQWKKVNKLTYK